MLGTLGTLAGNTLQTGPGRVYRDGSLGCIGCGAVLQSGAGVAFKDGSLGGQLASGPGSAYREGVLGGPMQTGPGYAYRDGALGAARRLVRRRRLSGLGQVLSLSPELLLGLAIGAGGMYLFKRKG